MQYISRFAVATPLIAGCLLVLGSGPAQAEKLYKLVDEQGNVTYSDSKPENVAGEIEEQDASLPEVEAETDLDTLAEDTPIMFYSVPECAACDMVRTYLGNAGMPFTEVDVADDYDAQQSMKKDVGNLNVPTVSVGGRSLSGFNASALDTILDVAGYPVGGTPAVSPATASDTDAAGSETDEAAADNEDDVVDDLADDLKEDLQEDIENDNGDQTDADN